MYRTTADRLTKFREQTRNTPITSRELVIHGVLIVLLRLRAAD
jgi:hypothetical protein